jgi:hypothetical protein
MIRLAAPAAVTNATQHLPFLKQLLKTVWKFNMGIRMVGGFVIYFLSFRGCYRGMAGKGV